MSKLFTLSFSLAALFVPLLAMGEIPGTSFVEDGIKHYEEIHVNPSGGRDVKFLLPNQGAIDPKDVGIIVNTADPISASLGALYRTTYNIPQENLVTIYLPTLDQIGLSSVDPHYMYSSRMEDFIPVLDQIMAQLPSHVQVIALAFNKPFKIHCQGLLPAYGDRSINTAISLNLKTCSFPTWPVYED